MFKTHASKGSVKLKTQPPRIIIENISSVLPSDFFFALPSFKHGKLENGLGVNLIYGLVYNLGAFTIKKNASSVT